MIHILEQLITSLVATSCFCIVFNIPKKHILQCGFVGMAGWVLYVILIAYSSLNNVVSTLCASFLIAVISQIFARRYKAPIILFSVSGMIPLVPGGIAYDAMRHLVENSYNQAVSLSAEALLLSGSIAVGIMFAEVVNQVYLKHKKARRK